jgi:hypothetical protein
VSNQGLEKWLGGNKKSGSIGSNSPYKPVIKIENPNNFQN